MELIKGNLYKFKVKGFKNPVYGIFCSKNNEWYQLLHNAVDYTVDGIIYLNTNLAKPVKLTPKDEFTAEVIKSRRFDISAIKPLGGHNLILQLIDSKQLIEIQEDNEDSINVGYVTEIIDNIVVIEGISSKTEPIGELDYLSEEITTIKVNSDYLNALESYIKRDESPTVKNSFSLN